MAHLETEHDITFISALLRQAQLEKHAPHGSLLSTIFTEHQATQLVQLFRTTPTRADGAIYNYNMKRRKR